MRPTLSFPSLWLVALAALAGCGPADGAAERVGQQVYECPTADLPADRPGAAPPPASVNAVMAFDDAGALGLLDATTGALLALEPEPVAAPDALERDLAFDSAARRAIVFESDEEGQAGAIRVVPIDGGTGWFGPSEHRAWVDGRARVLGVPDAVAVFELGYGQRWKLLRDDGVPTPSRAAPPPASAWLADHGAPAIEALSAEDGPAGRVWRLARVSVARAELGEIESVGLDLGAAEVTTALARPWPLSDDLLVASLAGGELGLGRYDGGGTRVTRLSAGAAEGRLVDLAVLEPRPGGALRAAVLLAQPARLLIVELGADSLWQRELALPAALVVDEPMMSRALATISRRRLLVATSAAVEAIDVEICPDGPQPVLDADFDGSRWRGPLAALPARSVRVDERLPVP